MHFVCEADDRLIFQTVHGCTQWMYQVVSVEFYWSSMECRVIKEVRNTFL